MVSTPLLDPRSRVAADQGPLPNTLVIESYSTYLEHQIKKLGILIKSTKWRRSGVPTVQPVFRRFSDLDIVCGCEDLCRIYPGVESLRCFKTDIRFWNSMMGGYSTFIGRLLMMV